MNNLLDIVKEKFKEDRFAQNFGIVLDELTETEIKMHMVLKAKLNNLFARPHGGAIYALADAAFSVLGNNANNLSVAVECSISYHKSPEPESILFVEGKILALSRKLGTYYFELYKLDEGKNKVLIATMKSTLYRTGKQILKKVEN